MKEMTISRSKMIGWALILIGVLFLLLALFQFTSGEANLWGFILLIITLIFFILGVRIYRGEEITLSKSNMIGWWLILIGIFFLIPSLRSVATDTGDSLIFGATILIVSLVIITLGVIVIKK